MEGRSGDGRFSLTAVALHSGNRRRGVRSVNEAPPGKLRALLTTWRPTSRRKLSLPSVYRRQGRDDGGGQDFFGLGDISNEREIRTAVHYGGRAEASPYPQTFSNSAPLLRAHPPEGAHLPFDFCQLTTSPLKYVKKSRDSLLSSSDDDSSGDESRPPWPQAERDPEPSSRGAFMVSPEEAEKNLLSRARAKASIATGKEQVSDTLTRRPHSAPVFPDRLAYAIEALRLTKESTTTQPLTAPSSRAAFTAPSKTHSPNSHRNSVGLDSAIGLDDGRVSSLSSAESSSSNTPACQPNNPARRSGGTVSTSFSTLTLSLSTSSWGSNTALTSPTEFGSTTMSVTSDASLMSLNGSRGTDETATISRPNSPTIAPLRRMDSTEKPGAIVSNQQPTIVARPYRATHVAARPTTPTMSAPTSPFSSPGSTSLLSADQQTATRTSVADVEELSSLRRSNSVNSAFDPRKDGGLRRNLLDVISPSAVSVRMSSSESTLTASDSCSTLAPLTQQPPGRPRSLATDETFRSASHSDALEAIEEPVQTPTLSCHDPMAENNNGKPSEDITQEKDEGSNGVKSEDGTLPELPRLKKNYFPFSPGAIHRYHTTKSSDTCRPLPKSQREHVHRRRHSIGAIGDPLNFHRVGRLVGSPSTSQAEFHPEGARYVELLRPPNGPFGFYIALSRHTALPSGQSDWRLVISRITDRRQRKLLAGIMAEGDEILEVNGIVVRGGRCSLEHVYDIMKDSERLRLVTLPLLERRDW